MKFIFPCEAYREKAADYIAEFHACASQINGTGGLDRCLREGTYDDWLLKVRADTDIANIPPNRVPAFTYFYVREDDDRIVGMINIRLALNDFLRREGGHIGYSVRPSERGRSYATRMLREALAFCRTIGMTQIIVCCTKNNAASAAVIHHCSGVLDAEFYSENSGEVIQRYVISMA